MALTTTKNRPKRNIAVKLANHPAAFNKVVCPKCKLGHAVKDFNDNSKFTCDRCGMIFTIGKL